MSKRAFAIAWVLLPVLLSPAWAEDGPVATAPIPPAAKASPPPAPIVVPMKPTAPPKPNAAVAAATHQPQPVTHAAAAKPAAARLSEAAQPKPKAPAGHAARVAKVEKKPAKKRVVYARVQPPPPARTRTREEWVVSEQPEVPPPPYGPSWYPSRYGRGPLAYAPYAGGMRGPPPMPW